jgi:glycosyltransferase involved in cell wall biosynthesis
MAANMEGSSKKKMAIVCDWLVGIGGAERIIYELHKLFPDAPIYTSQYNPEKISWFNEAEVHTGWLNKLPSALKKFLPVLRAWYFSHLDLSDYDIVISVSSAEAKSIKTGESTIHIAYINSPTHYYWIRYDEYLSHPGFPKGLNWLGYLGLRVLVKPMRMWDFRAAQKPDYLIGNSTHIQAMIKKYYKRESTVVFPPVDVDRFKLPAEPPLRHGFVAAGRQTPYKRIDLAVAACTKLNVPLVVIGTGPEHRKLERMAGRSVIFLSNVTDEEMVNHFQTATALLFPTNIEDFGVTGVEAMAAGTPVIAYNEGGPLDYVVPGKTGLFFDKQDVKSLIKTIEGFEPSQYDSQKITESVKRFSVKEFRQSMLDFIRIHDII